SALVDRFVQHCHVMDIDADSWREKEAREFAAKPTSKPRAKPKRKPAKKAKVRR
ncbi:MAG: ATP-binding protein IstB, partial [Myxococcales bacterium]|nr:ATP-binding protein IstB [Myxococcales bacterium]